MKTFFVHSVYARWELVLMRGLFALVIWDALPLTGLIQPDPSGTGSTVRKPEWRVHYDTTPKPTGLAISNAEWVTSIATPAARSSWFAAVIVLLLMGYALGAAPIVFTPPLLALTVLYGTLNNSQGAITHHLQVVSLALLAQTAYLIWELVRRRKWRTGWLGNPADREGRIVWVTQQAVVATYVVSALTKLKESGFGWFVDAARFPIQLKKNNQMAYYNHLKAPNEADGYWASLPAKIEVLFLESPNLCRVVIGSGLVLELVAVLALVGRRWALAVGAVLVAFHLSISAVMSLDFRFNIYLLLIFFVLPGITAFLARWSIRATQRGKTEAKVR
jgi:hypothetical protein